jgi:ribosomal protein S6--L-glutamate ligase
LEHTADIRFGVVSAWPDEDWHSRRLLEACARRGVAAFLDPGALAATIDGDGLRVTHRERGLDEFDALVLARGLGRTGDGDVQFELYRALAESGSLVVNDIDALLAAQDKLRT